MELKQVIVVEMPDAIRRPPKATPCCLVCFEIEIYSKLFVVEDLECECHPYLHDVCVKEWFRIAGREVCPQCGQPWHVVNPCFRYEGCIGRCIVLLMLVILAVFAGVGLYQVIKS